MTDVCTNCGAREMESNADSITLVRPQGCNIPAEALPGVVAALYAQLMVVSSQYDDLPEGLSA